MFEATLFTLLHLLVFVYWLGGDIGVFYASTLLTDSKQDAAGRLMAAKILTDVDLAPRFCLIFTLPTGLALATVKGWLILSLWWVALAFGVAALWAWIVWKLHVDHGPQRLKQFDFGLRLLFLSGLIAGAVASLMGAIEMPLFIALKFLILAFAIAMGLLVRRALVPFGPAFAKLAKDGADPVTDAIIASSLSKSRRAVMCIWAALIIAAWLGIATPA